MTRASLAHTEHSPPRGRVVFGAKVLLRELESGLDVAYRIVGEGESDVRRERISVNSPVARALIGKEAGEIAVVQAPAGEREYEILAIVDD